MMTFTVKITIIDGQLQGVTFEDVAQPVTIGAALQAVDAAKAALLGIVIAQPSPQPGDGKTD
jgi:hypothetical protein